MLFEDEHLLVVNKPAGLNTHAPHPHAGEGLYEWLRHREPRWAQLAIVHRLDKETSGVMVFGKTPLANASLTDQFTRRAVRKTYLLLTDRPVRRTGFTVRSVIARAGQKYISRPVHAGGDLAETRFEPHPEAAKGSDTQNHLLTAHPLTGRTHQIRVHAADQGLPILGDVLYGGTPARRVFLHASSIAFTHPATGEEMNFQVPPAFEDDPAWQLRTAVIEPDLTNSYRLIHGASDGRPGWYVDRFGDFLLSQSASALNANQNNELTSWIERTGATGVYHKILTSPKPGLADHSPQPALGRAAPDRLVIRENALQFEISFVEGYSAGLFLDQRDNRRRLLTGHVAAGFSLFPTEPRPTARPEVLNTFAYTCAFSVCAAKAGAHTVSVDLSGKYLDWGKRNFERNNLDPAGHSFLRGDVFEWLRRLSKKGAAFDLVLLDPPTFSRSRESGVFQAQKHYRRLVEAALPLLKRGGVLFASTNDAGWEPEAFLQSIAEAAAARHRKITRQFYVPQPPDFPVSRSEPAYLKTVWLRVS